MQASCMGSRPWLISFSGMAEVMGWPKRPPLVAPLDRTRVLQTWASHCNGTAPGEHLVPFSAVRNMSPEQFVQLLAEDLQVRNRSSEMFIVQQLTASLQPAAAPCLYGASCLACKLCTSCAAEFSEIKDQQSCSPTCLYLAGLITQGIVGAKCSVTPVT